jgi:UDP-glucose 4-epimerase
VNEVFADFRPEVLIHHAASAEVRRSVADPAFDARVNILGLINLLEAARQNGTRRILFASSGGAAYGEQDEFPAPESHKLEPVSPYGVSKRSSELYLACYRAMYGLEYTAMRYANVYGPRQDPHGEAGVVAIFAPEAPRRRRPDDQRRRQADPRLRPSSAIWCAPTSPWSPARSRARSTSERGSRPT